MRLLTVNGLRFRHLRLAILAICAVFLLWKWEKGSLYSPDLLRPEPLALSEISVADSQFVDRNTSMDEGSSSSNPLVKSIAEVGKVVTAAPPPLTMIHNAKDATGKKETSPSEKKGCDYRNGGWVPDDRRPLYSGLKCKRWLSESWNCKLTQRKDFTYEKFRWQPEGCEMPMFQAAHFLRRMQDKTIAYVGDSLGRQMFQSMMCMVAASGKDHSDVEDVGSEYGLALARRAKRPGGWAYRFRSTNTTILYYWSATLCDLEPLRLSNPAAGYAMHLDRPPSFLKKNLHRFHVLVLNTGHHWNRGKLKANKWEMYVSGAPNVNGKIAVIWKAKNFTVHSVMKWLDGQLPSYPHLKVFYRSLSPRHFFNGEWNTGGTCDNKAPLSKGNTVFQNRSEDADAEGAVRGTRIKLLDITALSRLRDEGHISRYSIRGTTGVQDCLHWCLPGVPDTWNEILAAQL
ncbi:protein trichome birefringence-like 14 isoform X2 [Lolium perenne]|uniref:protein trichome birefringence-like 14 isoform X2 n=2 Tax=Lolium perenne TaxID=4522 RepID=UPI003A9A1E04